MICPLVGGQLAGLVDDLLGHGDLADVVQQRAELEVAQRVGTRGPSAARPRRRARPRRGCANPCRRRRSRPRLRAASPCRDRPARARAPGRSASGARGRRRAAAARAAGTRRRAPTLVPRRRSPSRRRAAPAADRRRRPRRRSGTEAERLPIREPREDLRADEVGERRTRRARAPIAGQSVHDETGDHVARTAAGASTGSDTCATAGIRRERCRASRATLTAAPRVAPPPRTTGSPPAAAPPASPPAPPGCSRCGSCRPRTPRVRRWRRGRRGRRTHSPSPCRRRPMAASATAPATKTVSSAEPGPPLRDSAGTQSRARIDSTSASPPIWSVQAGHTGSPLVLRPPAAGLSPALDHLSASLRRASTLPIPGKQQS